MSAFWDDLASDLEIQEFADAYWAACERIASQIAGQEVSCEGRAQVPEDWTVSMHEFATGLGHPCPDCKAVV